MKLYQISCVLPEVLVWKLKIILVLNTLFYARAPLCGKTTDIQVAESADSLVQAAKTCDI